MNSLFLSWSLSMLGIALIAYIVFRVADHLIKTSPLMNEDGTEFIDSLTEEELKKLEEMNAG